MPVKSNNNDTEDISHTKTLEPGMVSEHPTTIGPYKVLDFIGKGGMGTVYLAQQEKPIKRKVAIKVIKPGMDSKEVIARFESEQQALALMNHPNIAQVYDSGITEQGHPYFVMEYVPGKPITKHCDKYTLTTTERLKLFQSVCDAIQHAHYKGIVHRDIKPTNILVSYQDEKHVPKIIDFGVAKALTSQGLTEKTLHTQQGITVGTPTYMSPEQAALTGYDIDTRTDVYSLGVLLYEILVGTTPFDKEELRKAGIIEILRIIREVDPPKPKTRFDSIEDTTYEIAKLRGTNESELKKLLKSDLEWIIMKALEKDRRRRYSSAEDFAEDINRYLNQVPIQAHPPSLGYLITKRIRRHKATSLVLLSILLLISISYFWNVAERRNAEKSLKEAYFNYAIALKEKAKLSAEKKDWPSVKLLSANSLLYQLRAEKFLSMGDIEYPFLYQDLKLKLSIFLPYELELIFMEDWNFSKEGKFLVLSRIGGIIEIFDMFKKEKVTSLKMTNVFCPPSSLGPKGKCIAVKYDYNTVKILELPQGNEIRVISDDTKTESLDFSPDGKLLASRGEDRLTIWNVADGMKVFSKDGLTNENETRQNVPISFCPEGARVATVSSVDSVTIWDISDGKEIVSLKGHQDGINCLCFSPNGKFIVTGSEDKTIKVWEVLSGELKDTFNVQYQSFLIEFSPDGNYLLTSFIYDNAINILDIQNGRVMSDLKGSHGKFGPIINYITTYRGETNQIDFWEISNAKSISSLKSEMAPFRIKCSKDGKFLASLGTRGMEVWNLTDRKLLFEIQREFGATKSDFGFTDDNRLTVLGKEDRVIAYDIPSGEELSDFRLPAQHSVAKCTFSPDGKYFAAKTIIERAIRVFDTKSWQVVSECEVPERWFSSLLAISHDGKYLASELASVAGGRNHEMKIWDIATGKLVATLRGHTEYINLLSFSPDGKYLASGSYDKTIKIWDVSSFKEEVTLKGHNDEIKVLNFSPDGKWLVSGSEDSPLKIWSVTKWKEITTLNYREGNLTSITFSKDNRYLISTDVDQNIDIWDFDHFINQLWLGLEIPYDTNDVIELKKIIEQQTGLVLEGNNAVDHGYYYELGNEFAVKGQFERCIEEYKKALRLKPDFIMAKQSLGEMYFVTRDYDKSLAEFKKVIAIDDSNVSVQFYIAAIYLAQNKFDDAYNLYIDIEREFDLLPGDFAVGKNSVTQLMAAQSDLAFAHLIRGYLNKKIGAGAESKEDLNKFMSDFKGDEKWKSIAGELLSELEMDSRTNMDLGNTHFRNEEYETAIAFYEKVGDKDGYISAALTGLGKSHFRLEKYDLAADKFRKSIEIIQSEANRESYFYLALISLIKRDFEDSYKHFERARFTDTTEFHYVPNDLIREVDKIIQKNENLPFSFLILGYLHVHRRNFQTAKDLLGRFIHEFKGEEKWKDIAKELLADLEKE